MCVLVVGGERALSVVHSASPRLHQFGLFLHRHRWQVVLVWVLLIAVGALVASRAGEVLKGGAGGIPNSSSALAAELIAAHFENPFRYTFVVTVETALPLEGPAFRKELGALVAAARTQPHVLSTLSLLDQDREAWHGKGGSYFLVGVEAKNHLEAEQLVAPTRAVIDRAVASLQASDPSLKVHLTGDIPIGHDVAQALVKDTAATEAQILPWALLLLLLAFGSVIAAGVPIGIGAAATMLALAMLVGVGQFMNLSSMAQNISSMVGLGVGIDYALIIVSRFRESLGRGLETAEAVGETMATAGAAIIYSGATVVIGFLALFIPGLIDTTSMAVAGSLTVVASVGLAITLLPAVLGILGRRIDWPSGMAHLIARLPIELWWYRWAKVVMGRPGRFMLGGVALLLLLSWPGFGVRYGQFTSEFFPPMESAYGMRAMERMGQAGQSYPLQLVFYRKDGEHVFGPKHLEAMAPIVAELQAHPAISEVHSIVEHASRLILLNNLFFNGDVAKLRKRFPDAVATLTSADGKGTVVQIIPKTTATFAEIKAFTRSISERPWNQLPGLEGVEVAVGGYASANNDYEDAVLGAMPWVIGSVVVVTFVLLAYSFRSLLLPLKALVMNGLSVAASFGALVLVFQEGYGSSLIGFPNPPGVMIVIVPLIVFAAVFGLSMDYEVFLLSRIQEEYLKDGDHEHAVAAGLAATGGIITNAAAIMFIVFGAFALANIILTKMLGFGLAVAVLVDALVIRVMLVPSFMAMAGKWCWWPHILPPQSPSGAAPQPAGDPPLASAVP